ncbi:MAG: FecR domain-containing protein [Bacteroidota bacterium]|nr:FecR domain-containing protein [Bacteroidota bacterium]
MSSFCNEDLKIEMEEKIIKYIVGELNSKESALVEGWISESDDNFELYRQYYDVWVATLYPKAEKVFDADAAWDKFNSGIEEKRARMLWKQRLVRFISSSAAIFIIAIGMMQLFKAKPELKHFNAQQKAEIEFNDGSIAYVNKNSEINYPEKFFGDTREISIFGEAFFNVQSNKEKPFIVTAGDFRVKVLGTKFNVKNVGAGSYEVFVESGKVSVYHKNTPENNKLLLPGQMALLSVEGIVYRNSSSNYLSWKTDELVFDNVLLKDVVSDIETYYGVSILVTEQETERLRLTAHFENKTLDEVLDVITLIFDLEKEKRETEILLKPKV